MKQNEIRFGTVRSGMRAMSRIEVVNGGKRPQRLSWENVPAGLCVYTESVVIQPDSVADLVFIFDAAGMEPGKQEAHVMLGGVQAPPSERFIKLTAEVK